MDQVRDDESVASSVGEPVIKDADRATKAEFKSDFEIDFDATPAYRPGDSPVMRVFPPVVEFHGIEVGTLYVITLTIQNTSSTVRRVRFQPPKSKAFTLRNEPKGGLAPGLDVTADIEFFAETEEDFHDKLIVVSGKYKVEIPLHAFAPAPRIEFDGFVDFGICVSENAVSKIVEFKNVGMAIGEYEIEYDEDLPIKIEPKRGTLHPLNPPLKIERPAEIDSDDEADDDESVDSEASSAIARRERQEREEKARKEAEENFPKKTSERIRIDYTGTELGAFRALAKVRMVGQPDRVLDINAQLVEQSLELVLPEGGGQVSNLNFGTLYFGHERSITTLLVNNGPFPASFQIRLSEDDGAGAEEGEDEEDEEDEGKKVVSDDKTPPPFISSPPDGIIQPYAQLPVIITFNPHEKKKKTGWAKSAVDPNDLQQTFGIVGSVECVDTNQTIGLQLAGKAVVANVRIDASTFDFGDCPVHDRRDILTTITNDGADLVARWSIPRIAQFCFKPNRGALQPGQSQNILVSYNPTQLGRFNKECEVQVENGAKSIPLRVIGSSETVGKDRKKIVGGPEAIPADFQPKYKFVRQDDPSLNLSPKKKFRRGMPWEESLEDMAGQGTGGTSGTGTQPEINVADARYTFSVPDLIRRQAHRGQYNQFLHDMRIHRKRQQVNAERKKHGLTVLGDPNGVDMGMNPRAGLRSPQPGMPKESDPLWLERPMDEDGGAPRRRVKPPANENQLIKRKFKPSPTTPAEVRDIDADLTPENLKDIVSGPKTLDFGRIVVRSVVAKSFAVGNNLAQNILVSMVIEEEEMQRSTPQSQLIPPGEIGGFDIIFSSRDTQNYRKTIQYTVNNKYQFKFNVQADVVPIQLDLSAEEVNFRFTSDDMEPSISETITVSNPGNAPADFQWKTGRAGVFSVEPMKGTVPPFKEMDVQVTFRPVAKAAKNETLKMSVAAGQGAERSLIVDGESTEGKVAFKEKSLDLGNFPVGISMERTINVKNLAKTPSVFYLESAAPGITVTPNRGRVGAGGVVEAKISIKAPKEHDYSADSITVQARGGKVLALSLMGESMIPDLSVVEEEIDFGGVTIGSTMKQPITLSNSGTIQATVFVDLERYPEFNIGLAPAGDGQQTDLESVFVPVADTRLNSASTNAPSTAGGGKRSGSSRSKRKSKEADDGGEAPAARKFRLTIDAGRNLKLNLIYSPQHERSHVFEVPLLLAGIEGRPPEGMRRVIVAEGLKPRLLLSRTTVDFGDRVVSRDKGMRFPYHTEVTLTNRDETVVAWECDMSELNLDRPATRDSMISATTTMTSMTMYGGGGATPPTFSMEPASGELEPGEARVVKVSFLPQDAIPYDAEMPIYLDGNTARPYLMIQLKANGMYPKLNFSCEEVVLPAVPLGLKSKARFEIINNGYDQLEVSYQLPIDSQHIPLKITFPEGKQIGLSKNRLPVEVSFASRKAMAFTAKIEFIDTTGNRFTIPVSGSSDACLLTTYPFVKANFDQYGGDKKFSYYVAPEKAIQFFDNGTVRQMLKADAKKSGRTTPRELETPFGMAARGAGEADSASVKIKFDHESVEALRSWLNCTAMKNPIDSIPKDFIDSNGKILIELIETLTGRNVPGKVTKLSANKREHPQQLYKQYEECLAHLKGHGALLNHIRPETLLSKADYVHICSHREATKLTPSQLLHRKKELEKEFKTVSLPAWVTTLYQIIKVYVLNRVTQKQYENLPGVDSTRPLPGFSSPDDSDSGKKKRKKPKNDPALVGSNIFSVSEGLLLKWLTYHYVSLGPENPKRLTNFEEDLKDGSVLCYLLQSHVPTIAGSGRPLFGFKRKPQTDEEAALNANKFISGMRELGLDLSISPNAFVSPNGCNMLLLVIYLYQNLPQYVPKTTIEFFGVLGERVVKNIELRNPAKKGISYWVTVEGSPDFKIEKRQLLLDPGAIEAFPIEFISRFTKTVTGRLTFRAQRDGGVNAATMVFNLKSMVHSRKAVFTEQVKTITYEPQTVELEIANNFSSDVVFQLTLTQDILYNNKWEDAMSIIHGTKGKKKGIGGKKKGGPSGKKGGIGMRKSDGARKSDAVPVSQLPEELKDAAFFKPFWCRNSTLKVKANSTNTITVQFLPLQPGNYRCQLIFLDERVGETMYEILGTAEMPKPMEVFTSSMDLTSSVQRHLSVPFLNTQLDKARNTAMDRYAGGTLKKMRDALKMYMQSEKPPQLFSVEFNSPFYQSAPDCLIGEVKETATVGKAVLATPRGAMGDGQGSVMVNFQPSQPGEYPAQLIMRSQLEVRVYDFYFTVKAPSKEKALEFEAPARQKIVQDIPIINNSDKEWTIGAKITGEGSQNFKGSKAMKVKPGEEGSYKLEYKADWVSETSAQLTLTNATTGEDYVFKLRGTADEPLAEEHVRIECQARQRVSRKFRVKNNTKNAIVYNVECDIPGISGEATIEVGPNSTGEYELFIRPLLGGEYSGAVTFIAPDGSFTWYTLEIFAEAPTCEDTLTLQSFVRKAVAVEIGLQNPLEEPIEFEVKLVGRGLLGDPVFVLGPGEAGTYELLYSPLIPSQEVGSIVFANQYVGEVWYELQLIAESAPPEQLEDLECCVGLRARRKVQLENPTGELITLTSDVSNQLNFRAVPATVVIQPYGTTHAEIEYTPSSIDEIQRSSVVFKNPKLGTWKYIVQGRGTPPSTMDTVEVFSPMGVRASATFSFRNPFSEAISVSVKMFFADESGANAFTLLMKKSDARVPAFSSLQVPFIFAPPAISEYHATVEVEAGQGMLWTYPVKGTAEAPPIDDIISISTAARKPLSETLPFYLRSIDPSEANPSTRFSHSMVVPDEFQSIVNKSLQISQNRTTLKNEETPLTFNFDFNPLKPFKANVEFIISKSSGGRWRYPMVLNASEPAVDDTIVIEAMMNQTSSVSFKMSNHFNAYSDFTAKFTPDSPYEFTVYPNEGVLEPPGHDGTNFIVSFTPTEYGKTQIGRLVIQTEEMQWTYEVRGTPPLYVPPTGKTTVNTRMDPNLTKNLGKIKKKNFMRANTNAVRKGSTKNLRK